MEREMDCEMAAKISEYLRDEEQLYQDWYLGFIQVNQASKPGGELPDLSELKKMCEDWMRQQAPVLKEKLCEVYRQKKRDFQQPEFLIASVADILRMIFTQVNVVAVATILVRAKYLAHWCDCASVAGKMIEELTVAELQAIASEAGREAYENARRHGFRVTALREGQIVWLYPDGHVEPIAKA